MLPKSLELLFNQTLSGKARDAFNSSAGFRRTGCAWPARAPGMGPARGYQSRVPGKTRVQEMKSLPLSRARGARRSRRLGLRLGGRLPGACKVAGSCCDHQQTPSRCDHMVQPNLRGHSLGADRTAQPCLVTAVLKLNGFAHAADPQD